MPQHRIAKRFAKSLAVILALGLVALLAAVALDRHRQRTGPKAFLPSSVQRYVELADAETYWTTFSDCAELAEFAALLRERFENSTIPIPTVLTRLGASLVVGISPEGTGFHFRPSLIQRMSLRIGPTIVSSNAESAYHVEWRDGVLCVATSPAYLTAAGEENALPIVDLPPMSQLRVTDVEHDLQMAIENDASLSFHGEWARPNTKPPAETREHAAHWSGDPILVLAGADGALEEVFDELYRFILTETPLNGLEPLLDQLKREWRFKDWRPSETPPGADWTFALHQLDACAAMPVPQWEFRQHGPEAPPPVFVAAEADSFPVREYLWPDSPGLAAPLAGETATLCWGYRQNQFRLASSEPVMHRSVAGETAVERYAGQGMIRVDWKRFAEAATELMIDAARLELVPERNAADVESDYLPWLDALSEWGAARVNVSSTSGAILFDGALLLAPEGTAP